MATNKSTNTEAFAKLEAHTKKLEARISSLKAHKEALEQRHQNILSHQDRLMKDHGGSNISSSDMIRLNVRGTEMCARRDTLTTRGRQYGWRDRQMADWSTVKSREFIQSDSSVQ